MEQQRQQHDCVLPKSHFLDFISVPSKYPQPSTPSCCRSSTPTEHSITKVQHTLVKLSHTRLAFHRLPCCSSTRATSSPTWRPSSGNFTTCSRAHRMTNWRLSETNTRTSKSHIATLVLMSRLVQVELHFWVLMDSSTFSGCSSKLLPCRLSVRTLWKSFYRHELLPLNINRGEMLPCLPICVYIYIYVCCKYV